VPLKYSQETSLSGRGEGIVVTPYTAGHSLGGAIWKIAKDNDEIAYAVEYNHRKERHLNGTVIEAVFNKPSVLITDAYAALSTYVPRKDRDTKFFERILDTLRGSGSVLLPVEFAGRTLELFLMLHTFWEVKKLHAQFQLVLLSHSGYHLLEYAKSFIEWMSDSCQSAFDKARENPFSLKHVFLCYSMEELEEVMQQKPVVVLAPSRNMNCSFAEDVLSLFSKSSTNLVLFTYSSPDPESLASKVFELQNPNKPKNIKYRRRFKVPLEGQELKNYMEQKRLEAKNLQKEEESDSESESEGEDEVISGNKRIRGQIGGLASEQIFKKRARLAPSFPMYLAKDVHTTWDDYGEVIRLEDFLAGSTNSAGVFIPLLASSETGDDGGAAMNSAANARPIAANQPAKDEDVVMEEEEEALEEEDFPSKDVEEDVELNVLCSVLVVPFEGRVDGRSLRNILTRVMPRKIILVKGSAEAKRNLQQYAESNICRFVMIAKNQTTLGITSEARAFQVKLKDSLEKSLNLVRIKEIYEVAHVEGKLEWESGFGLPSLKRVEEHESEGHTMVFLGDVKLPDIQKAVVSDCQLEAEFVSGILVCGEEGTVNIRKSGDNTINIKGSISEDYFKIRDAVYNQFHLV
jgi:cleavage and polyadenylation specificity factor subunit 2